MSRVWPAKNAVIPTIIRMLKIADPTMVPTPAAPSSVNTEVTKAVMSSGAEDPAAMKVAPATSSSEEYNEESVFSVVHT